MVDIDLYIDEQQLRKLLFRILICNPRRPQKPHRCRPFRANQLEVTSSYWLISVTIVYWVNKPLITTFNSLRSDIYLLFLSFSLSSSVLVLESDFWKVEKKSKYCLKCYQIGLAEWDPTWWPESRSDSLSLSSLLDSERKKVNLEVNSLRRSLAGSVWIAMSHWSAGSGVRD